MYQKTYKKIFLFYFFDSAQEKMSDEECRKLLSSDEECYFKRRKKRLQKEEQRAHCRSWGGSRPGKSQNIERGRVLYHDLLMQDYFVDEPIYSAQLFRRRFRMRRELFERIKKDLLEKHADTWERRADRCGVIGFSTEQKITGCLRLLAYGSAADSIDEYVRMAETTALKYLELFCTHIISLYSSYYLRSPTAEDLKYLFSLHSSRGFPGKIGSLDVMHWEWKNCPVAWAGQFKSGELFCFDLFFCFLIIILLTFSLFYFLLI